MELGCSFNVFYHDIYWTLIIITIVADLVDIEDYYLSPEFIEVTFKGTLQPTIEWLVDGFSLTSAVTDLIPSESVAWASNTVTFKLTNSRTSYATFTLQAKLTFSASAEVVATTAATVYKRGNRGFFNSLFT